MLYCIVSGGIISYYLTRGVIHKKKKLIEKLIEKFVENILQICYTKNWKN